MAKSKKRTKRGTRFGRKLMDRWATFRQLLRKCEVVIEVLDARDINETRLRRIEHWAGRERLIKIANKIDLADTKTVSSLDKTEFLPINSKTGDRKKQRDRIIDAILAKGKERPRVLVVGYPNVGKSTIINLLAGRNVVRATPIAGTTTNIQWIRLPHEILLMDSPGVFPEMEKRDELLRKGALNIEKLENFEYYGLQVAKKCLESSVLRKWLEEYFDIKIETNNPEQFIELIAKRRGFMLKGGMLNIVEASKALLKAFSESPKS